MARFSYIARNRKGEKVQGFAEADNRREAMAVVERQGLIPVSVEEAGKEKKPLQEKRKFKFTAGDKMRTRDVLTFTTELSDLLSSGMNLGSALDTLARRKTGNAQDTIIASLKDDIVQGASLSEALAKHPKTFSHLYVSMIQAGETSGALDEVLRRLVDHYERVQDIKEKVFMALVYPSIVIILGLATLVFSMIYVVPKFKAIFDQLGATLPLPTRILIATSGWLAKYGWAVLVVIGVAAVMANRLVKTERGERARDNMLLKMPLVKGIVACAIYSNFARTLSTLLKNGVPVLEALGIVEKTVGNVVIGSQIHNARDRVTDGTTISGPLASGKVFPAIMTDMMAVGESTGDMPGSLNHVARRYEGELERNVRILTTMLEPILIVVVAVLVGFVAISILMAVFNLTNGLDV